MRAAGRAGDRQWRRALRAELGQLTIRVATSRTVQPVPLPLDQSRSARGRFANVVSRRSSQPASSATGRRHARTLLTVEFLLDPDVVYLNHGSFGACPVEVFEEYQRLQRRLEEQPVRFLQRERPALVAAARAALAEYVGAEPGDVAFVTNPTFAVNEIARSLTLGPGDEVLTTNHEYGACRNVWQFVAERTGCTIVEAPLPITTESDAALVDAVFASATSRTKVLFVSHISSPTALTFPVAELCARARDRGLVTIVDGAHGPGQVDLDVGRIGADFYVGACHKWLCAPKGASFLVATPNAQRLLDPLVVGWGWGEHREFDLGSPFLDQHEWLGTHDPAAVLSVPTAIAFQRRNDWPTVRADCHRRAIGMLDIGSEVPGVERVHADDRFVQMAVLELGDSFLPAAEVDELRGRLMHDWRVEVPVTAWVDEAGRARRLVRVSIQAYNTDDHVEHLARAMHGLATR